MGIHINDVAAQVGATREHVERMLDLNHIPSALNLTTGDRWLTKAIAARVISVYQHTANMPGPRETPEHLREDFTREERMERAEGDALLQAIERMR